MSAPTPTLLTELNVTNLLCNDTPLLSSNDKQPR